MSAPTMQEVILAFNKFIELFSKEERDRVFKSREYVDWCMQNNWLVGTPSDERLK